jgi:hypothetical protein
MEKTVNLNGNKPNSALPRGKNLKIHTNASYLASILSKDTHKCKLSCQYPIFYVQTF